MKTPLQCMWQVWHFVEKKHGLQVPWALIFLLTCWWIHCSSSWVESQSWAPRRRGGWCAHRAQRHCGWPPGTWHRSCPTSCACTATCESGDWFPRATPAPAAHKAAANAIYYQDDNRNGWFNCHRNYFISTPMQNFAGENVANARSSF